MRDAVRRALSPAARLKAHSWTYLLVVLVLFCLVPLIRRLIDWKIGYNAISIVSILPLLLMFPVAAWFVYSGAFFKLPRPLFVCAWLWFGGFTYALVIAVAANPSALLASSYAWVLFCLPALFVLWVSTLEPSANVLYERVAGFLLWFSVPLCVYAAVQFVAPQPWDVYWMQNAAIVSIGVPEPYQLRVFSTLNSPGTFGDFLVFVILLNLPRMGLHRPLRIAFVALCAGTVVLTMVRSDWVALAIGVLCYIVMTPARVKTLSLVGTAVILCAILVANASILLGSSAVGNELEKRVSTFTDLSADDSYNNRAAYFGATLDAALAQPTGEGLGATGTAARLGPGGEDLPFDNGYIARLLEMGYFGAACYIATLVTALLSSYRRWSVVNAGGAVEDAAKIAGCIAVQVSLIFLDVSSDHHDGFQGVFFWLTLVLACGWVPSIASSRVTPRVSAFSSLTRRTS